MKISEDVLLSLSQRPEEATPGDVLALIEEIYRVRELKGIRVTRPAYCKVGHELTPENVYQNSTGTRRCRICTRRYQREYQKKHPEKYERILVANQRRNTARRQTIKLQQT